MLGSSLQFTVSTFLTSPMPPTQVTSLTLLALMEESPDALYDLDVVDEIIDKVKASIASDNAAIGRPARGARDLIKEADKWRDDSRVNTAFK